MSLQYCTTEGGGGVLPDPEDEENMDPSRYVLCSSFASQRLGRSMEEENGMEPISRSVQRQAEICKQQKAIEKAEASAAASAAEMASARLAVLDQEEGSNDVDEKMDGADDYDQQQGLDDLGEDCPGLGEQREGCEGDYPDCNLDACSSDSGSNASQTLECGNSSGGELPEEEEAGNPAPSPLPVSRPGSHKMGTLHQCLARRPPGGARLPLSASLSRKGSSGGGTSSSSSSRRKRGRFEHDRPPPSVVTSRGSGGGGGGGDDSGGDDDDDDDDYDNSGSGEEYGGSEDDGYYCGDNDGNCDREGESSGREEEDCEEEAGSEGGSAGHHAGIKRGAGQGASGSSGSRGSSSRGSSVSSRQRRRRGSRAGQAPQECWLCTFSSHPLSRQIESFINNSIASMDVLHVAMQCRQEILSAYPYARGAEVDSIKRHVTEHMLSPQVKLAAVLRSLTTLAETLRATLHQKDPHTGEILIDLKSTEAYLKVLSQLCSTYKMEPGKLLFSKGVGTAGAPSAAPASAAGVAGA